jgi:hypothetical protein
MKTLTFLAVVTFLILPITDIWSQDLKLNDLEYFENQGVNVLIYNNLFTGGFNDEKNAGIEIIHHGVRTAQGGAVRLSNTPEQWDLVPEIVNRRVNRASHYHQGRLHKMVENANRETYYIWEGNRIVKEEQYTNGLLSKYVLYNYDQAGNIGEAAFHYRQPDGSLKMGLLFVYLYFTDGNLYKKMAYNPIEGSEEYSLISTITYDNYLDAANPFPLEILPTVNPQPKLPGSFSEEGNGHYNVYNFSYEFDGDGRPLKRTAVSAGTSEVTTYTYR